MSLTRTKKEMVRREMAQGGGDNGGRIWGLTIYDQWGGTDSLEGKHGEATLLSTEKLGERKRTIEHELVPSHSTGPVNIQALTPKNIP